MTYDEFKKAVIRRTHSDGAWKFQSKDFNKWLEEHDAEYYIKGGYETLKISHGQYLDSIVAATSMNIEWD